MPKILYVESFLPRDNKLRESGDGCMIADDEKVQEGMMGPTGRESCQVKRLMLPLYIRLVWAK